MNEATETGLPTYSGDDPFCPKCNQFGATTTYMQGGVCYHYGSHNEVIGVQPNERLHRGCRTCGYQWDEAVRS